MASKDANIQVIEGGPEYLHWATEKTLQSLIDTLKTSGFSQTDIDKLRDDILELDINPLLINKDGCSAVDSLLVGVGQEKTI